MVLRSPTVQVESIDNSSYNGEFRLHCRSRTFIFYTESDEDRKYWVKNLDMSIKGTHPEEKHTKEVHNQAKSLINDAAAEVTVYSSKSDDSGDEDQRAPTNPPTKRDTQPTSNIFVSTSPVLTNSNAVSSANIDVLNTNPFFSTQATSPFATTQNPFLTGRTAPQQGTVYSSGNPFLTASGNPFVAPAGFAGSPMVNPFATGNPFLTVPSGSSSPPFTPVPTGTINPFLSQAYMTAPGSTSPTKESTNMVNPFATNQNPFLCQ
eukprot:TRINITY_DN2036_c1_g1_i20.p1 TRINITY_DN2036_c1_g1~~TRINITY_DN2036_c1_g1_i20.p1  ORF type:complete len:263 (+),score=30.45 TRINITY_DN2036_c1_g1_i20:332-1120(+)